jgi:hypothetical protein
MSIVFIGYSRYRNALYPRYPVDPITYKKIYGVTC